MKVMLLLRLDGPMKDRNWFWELACGNECYVSSQHEYETKWSAKRAARVMAKKFGLTITKTIES